MHPECHQRACSISIEKGQSGMIPCLNCAQSLGPVSRESLSSPPCQADTLVTRTRESQAKGWRNTLTVILNISELTKENIIFGVANIEYMSSSILLTAHYE